MSRIALTVGTYDLKQFAELQLRSLREIFGDAPLLLYDGRSRNSEAIKEIADKFDASYLSEEKNRGHFQGCIQSAVCSLAFAYANDCEISVKLNQRTILISKTIPDLIRAIFNDSKINLAMPRSPRVETIIEDASKFHSRFSVSPDMICIRASAVDPKSIADTYAHQVQTDTSRHATLTEHFWDRQTQTAFKDKWRELDFMREPNGMFLRKCQHSEAQYAAEAKRLGMSDADFPTAEWSAILGTAYRPLAAFA